MAAAPKGQWSRTMALGSPPPRSGRRSPAPSKREPQTASPSGAIVERHPAPSAAQGSGRTRHRPRGRSARPGRDRRCQEPAQQREEQVVSQRRERCRGVARASEIALGRATDCRRCPDRRRRRGSRQLPVCRGGAGRHSGAGRNDRQPPRRSRHVARGRTSRSAGGWRRRRQR